MLLLLLLYVGIYPWSAFEWPRGSFNHGSFAAVQSRRSDALVWRGGGGSGVSRVSRCINPGCTVNHPVFRRFTTAAASALCTPNPVQASVAHVALQTAASVTSNFLQTFYDADAMWTDLNFRWFLVASSVYGLRPTLTKTPSSVDGEYISVECSTVGKIPTKVYLSTWRSDDFDQYYKSPVSSFWTNMYKPTVTFGSL